MKENQVFHLEPPYGLLNDPNAILRFKDKYYIFFQWNPIAKDHSFKEWGYFTTTNFLDWNFEGKAIRANSFYDRDGVYSGTGLVYDDKIYLYYTGNTKPGGKRKSYQNLVVSSDGVEFEKEGILFATPDGFTEHVRDPKVFIHKKRFYMLLAAQEKSGYGAIILYTSVNPVDFHFRKIIAETRQFEMVECPDMAFLDGKVLLNYALQKRNNELDKELYSKSYYKVEDFDFDKLRLSNSNLDENLGLIDYGFDYYVPQTYKLEDGTTIMVAWMSNMTKEEILVYSKDSYSIHCFTMFRKIHLEGNHLYQEPIEIYKELLDEKCKFEDNILEVPQRQYYLDFNFKNCKNFELDLNSELKFEFKDGVFKTIRKNFVTNKLVEREIDLKYLDKIEIWADTSSVEAYINNGEYTSSSRVEPKSNSVKLSYIFDGEKIDSEAYTIKYKAN